MPIGVIADALSVMLGGLAGSVLGKRLPDDLKEKMNWVFGVCSLGMGVSSIALMKNMPAVVFAVVIGTLLGLSVKLGRGVEKAAGSALRIFLKDADMQQKSLMLTAVILFCTSGTGIYGSLDSGMTGNHSILLTKAMLDFFTSLFFACSLGKSTALIAIPQFVIFSALFMTAKVILPITTETMICDFKACGGFLLLATGLRIMQLRAFPIADMVPAMALVMPMSYLWTDYLLPLIG